jgi:hypothetical protein
MMGILSVFSGLKSESIKEVLANQSLSLHEEQEYGKETVFDVMDMFKLIFLHLIDMVERNRVKKHHVICILKR